MPADCHGSRRIAWQEKMKMAGNKAVLVPAHPGMILREEFMKGLGLTPYKVAKAIKVPLPRLNDIVRETRGISPEMGLRLSAYFGTTEQYWINLQADYERRVAKAKLADKLKEIEPLEAA